jgi:hypothetical protein
MVLFFRGGGGVYIYSFKEILDSTSTCRLWFSSHRSCGVNCFSKQFTTVLEADNLKITVCISSVVVLPWRCLSLFMDTFVECSFPSNGRICHNMKITYFAFKYDIILFLQQNSCFTNCPQVSSFVLWSQYRMPWVLTAAKNYASTEDLK